jgi:hypothetical protein
MYGMTGLPLLALVACLTELGLVHQGVAKHFGTISCLFAQRLDVTRPVMELRQEPKAASQSPTRMMSSY